MPIDLCSDIAPRLPDQSDASRFNDLALALQRRLNEYTNKLASPSCLDEMDGWVELFMSIVRREALVSEAYPLSINKVRPIISGRVLFDIVNTQDHPLVFNDGSKPLGLRVWEVE